MEISELYNFLEFFILIFKVFVPLFKIILNKYFGNYGKFRYF